jgi:hypothetical protein
MAAKMKQKLWLVDFCYGKLIMLMVMVRELTIKKLARMWKNEEIIGS